MKNRYTTVDIIAIVKEIKENYLGYRVIQVYDIDNKTFLIKLSKSGEEGKVVMLLESGIRFHITEFEWPKNVTPSGFSMKLRKHIKNRRLESITQLGLDRIVDLQFGSKESAYHIIIELYDKGNMFLTDYDYTILHLLRPRVDNTNELKFLTKEHYPITNAVYVNYKDNEEYYCEKLKSNIEKAKGSDNIRKICASLFAYGPNLLEHILQRMNLSISMKINHCLQNNSREEFISKLQLAFVQAQDFIEEFQQMTTKGLIFGKFNESPDSKELEIFEEFHPYLFEQLKAKQFKEYDSFNQAVDEYYSSIESQKTDLQMHQKEKTALKKLESIKQDHERRLKELRDTQEIDTIKGELIQYNNELVDRTILILNHAIAGQHSWDNIKQMIDEGKEANDPIAVRIVDVNFNKNEIKMRLDDPYEDEESESDNEDSNGNVIDVKKNFYVDTEIDLSKNAFENARKYFTMKKHAKTKEDKTINASEKALKNAERKTTQMLKEVHTVAKINKIRKTFWFEKFNWFISSEKYLVVGGKDQQQNEFLVKRYLKPGDLYVHADIHGASTVIIKNHEYPAIPDIPPKTLNEAAHMAVVYSSAWDSKIAAAAWWVRHDQVSKTAPTGEYLTTGAFMVRGKKNYLSVSVLTYGFGILFKITDESVERRMKEKQAKLADIQETNVDECIEDLQDINDEEEEIQEIDCDEEEEKEEEDKLEDNESKEEDSEFPDTKLNIKMSEVKVNEEDIDYNNSMESIKTHKYVSAKSRKNMKKCVQENSSIADEARNDEDNLDSDDESEEAEENEDTCTNKIKDSSESQKDHQQQVQLKRGQKGKLKKMKKKYKDQDDEDRKIRMALLQGKNPYEEGEALRPFTKKQKKKQEEELKKKAQEEKEMKKQMFIKQQKELAQKRKKEYMLKQQQNLEHDDAEEDQDDEETQENAVNINQQALNSLIGAPVREDEILFALPVLAPYQVLQSYKFKVKMIPGTTKRGKASKNILFSFVNDRTALPQEKNLIKALKDQDVTRNFPGKVKVFVSNLKKNQKN